MGEGDSRISLRSIQAPCCRGPRHLSDADRGRRVPAYGPSLRSLPFGACRSHAGYDSRRPPVFAVDQLTGTGLVASRAFLALITQFLATFAAIFTSVLAILAPAFTPVSAVFAPLFTAFHAG